MVTGMDAPVAAPRAGNLFSRGQSFLSSDEDSNAPCMPGPTARRRAPPRSIRGTRGLYLLGETLGSGVTSVVRAGIHTDTLLVVAIKVLDMHRLRRHPGGVDRVNAEIGILRELSKKSHPNVIALKDLVRDEAKRRIYLVMEMVNGAPVQNLIQEEGFGDVRQGRRLPHTQVANIIAQVLSALEYVHGRGFVHRDVKPANLLLTSTGTVKLSDFGVSESLDRYDAGDSVTRTSGTPAFQAPEIADGQAAYSGTKVDVWAVGVTAFYMLSGQLPFNALTHVQLYQTIAEGKYAFPEHVRDELPAEAVDAVEKMLRVNFKDRWSVAQLLRHPWIVSGTKQFSREEQADLGWSHVPAKTFGVLDLASRYMEADVQAALSNTADVSPPERNVSGDMGGSSPSGQASSSASLFALSLAASAPGAHISPFTNDVFDRPASSSNVPDGRRKSFATSLFNPPPPSAPAAAHRPESFASGLFDPPLSDPSTQGSYSRPENPLITPSSSDSDSSDVYPSAKLVLMDVPVVRRTPPRRARVAPGPFDSGAARGEQNPSNPVHQQTQPQLSTPSRAGDAASGTIPSSARHIVPGSGLNSDSDTDSDAELAAALSGAQVTRWGVVGVAGPSDEQLERSSRATSSGTSPAPPAVWRGSGTASPHFASGASHSHEPAPPGTQSPAAGAFAADSGENSDAELAAALDGAHVTRWSDLADVASTTAQQNSVAGATLTSGGDTAPRALEAPADMATQGAGEALVHATDFLAAPQQPASASNAEQALGGAFVGSAHDDSDCDSDAELFAALQSAHVVRWPGAHETAGNAAPMPHAPGETPPGEALQRRALDDVAGDRGTRAVGGEAVAERSGDGEIERMCVIV